MRTASVSLFIFTLFAFAMAGPEDMQKAKEVADTLL